MSQQQKFSAQLWLYIEDYLYCIQVIAEVYGAMVTLLEKTWSLLNLQHILFVAFEILRHYWSCLGGILFKLDISYILNTTVLKQMLMVSISGNLSFLQIWMILSLTKLNPYQAIVAIVSKVVKTKHTKKSRQFWHSTIYYNIQLININNLAQKPCSPELDLSKMGKSEE